jgi:predicted deacylase
LVVTASLAGVDIATPVFVQRGFAPGPALCLTAGIHGDEVNGVEVVRRVLAQVDAKTLKGTLISVPIVNVSAVRRGSRYLPDRRDLNRYFPGHPNGSAASRIAHRFFDSVIRHCDALVDIHTGSFHRSNLHQLRADLRRPQVLELARGLGSQIVIHNTGRTGTLRGAAVAAGVPAITIEGGEPARLSIPEVELGVASILRLMANLEMFPGAILPDTQPVQEFYDRGHWIRASVGGILVSRVELGQRVRQGQELGTITDPLSSRGQRILAPSTGRIVGMAFDQLVMPGFAAFHVAVREAPPGATPGLGLDLGLNLDPGEQRPLADAELEERPE